MELIETLRTTAAIREFTAEQIPDDVLHRVLDTARFAPSGGNAQSWRVVVVKDADKRAALRDIYLHGWRRYLAQAAVGLRPWAPITDRDAERAAVAAVDDAEAAGEPTPKLGAFAEQLDTAPVLLLLVADLRLLAAVDRDLGRYTFIGGASVYPFAWSILLAAREERLGGVITTMPAFLEADTKALFDVPDEFAVAALVVLGRPVHQPTKLRRGPVERFATVDSFGGAPFTAAT